MTHRACIPVAVLVALAALVPSLSSTSAADPPATPEYDRDIRPIFTQHCVSCHGAEKQRGGLRLDRPADVLSGGDSGAVIRPGKSADSALLRRVTSTDPAEQMPPKGERLTRDQVATLRAWVEQGAKAPVDSAAATPDHWAFRPAVRPVVPPGPTNHPIDAFVRAKLTLAGLEPSREADRRTLLRRLKFDLIGLPPTAEEVESFEQDRSPDAYEKRVEAYLASPQFGERWARHWLDVVRFAESHGFEMNHERPTAWPYRDYVIAAFNADKPYDQFVREQLAGDALGVDEATGFLVGGPKDEVGSPDPVLTAQQRADELHDVISTTGSAFLGLTVGCARCHNHKFDPITQTEYYRLKAAFAGVRHGERAWSGGPSAKDRDTLRAELAKADAALAELEPVADPRATTPRRLPVNARSNVERFSPVVARAVRFVILATTDAEPCIDELEVFEAGPTPRRASMTGAKVRSSGDYSAAPTIHRLEFLADGNYGNNRSWISNERGRGWAEIEFPRPVKVDRVVWGRDREGRYSDRLATRYRVDIWTADYEWVTVANSDDRAPLQASQPVAPPGLRAEDRAGWQKWSATREDLRQRLADLGQLGMVYAGRLSAPESTFRLHRGDPMQRREAVGPGAIAAVGPGLEIPAAADDSERRLAIARWVTNPQHPLTARVIVNRLWQHHYGTGIVDTPSDFGRNGGKPTHPELLDWLASELVSPTPRPGAPVPTAWALKHIHRLIVTSATYRQSSVTTPEGLAKDAQARLLWHYPPRRLEAEAIRDSILFVSGKLDTRMGGPGFSLFEPSTNYVRVYTPKAKFGPADFRRMVYAQKIRMQVDDTFGAFDCPDGGQIAPRRNASTTPLQALNLLNGEFLLQQAGFLADRVEREAGPGTEPRVRAAFRLAFQRAPTQKEVTGAVKLVEAHGLPALTRALLNANEFLYVD